MVARHCTNARSSIDAASHEQGSGVRASDASWQGGLLPWLWGLRRDSEGWGGALLVLDNAEQLLATTGNQPCKRLPPDASVRHACCCLLCVHSCTSCRVGGLH